MAPIRSSPRVSIGLPVYNGERYLSETLDSLLTQTFEDFELIICDNASKDRTEEICRWYAAKDARIHYFRSTTNLGAPKNYRRAFELSSGEYFRWANCDDLFSPVSLARCVEVLDRDSATILAYPKTKLINDRGEVISEYEDRLHLQSSRASERFVQLCTRVGLVNVIYGLIRSNQLRQTALIRNFIGADIALLGELALYGKFWEIPEFLFYRRIHPGASSSYTSIDQLQEFYDPNSKSRVVFIHWNYLWAHSQSVVRAPLGLSEKIRIGYFLTRKAKWSRNKLTAELVSALRQAVR